MTPSNTSLSPAVQIKLSRFFPRSLLDAGVSEFPFQFWVRWHYPIQMQCAMWRFSWISAHRAGHSYGKRTPNQLKLYMAQGQVTRGAAFSQEHLPVLYAHARRICFSFLQDLGSMPFLWFPLLSGMLPPSDIRQTPNLFIFTIAIKAWLVSQTLGTS